MSTYREIVYMCLDEIKLLSDDAYFTEDHIIFLADKYRALLLKKNYTDVKKVIPESNYQTICLDLEKVNDGPEGCGQEYLRSVETIPEVLPLGNPKVAPIDFLAGEFTYVSRERMKYVGHNKFLRNIVYCTIGPDNKLYLKSVNPQLYYLERAQFSGIFENPTEASKLECSTTGEETGNCDPLDKTYPLEEALIPMAIEMIVKELTGAEYKPKDNANDANDDLSDLVAFARRNMKSSLTKAMGGD